MRNREEGQWSNLDIVDDILRSKESCLRAARRCARELMRTSPSGVRLKHTGVSGTYQESEWYPQPLWVGWPLIRGRKKFGGCRVGRWRDI